MEYKAISEARGLPGLKLVVSAGVPGPWGEAAKAIFRHHMVSFHAVAQTPMQPNEELQKWTGCRNAPAAIPEDGVARTGWLEILLLAEQIGSGPSLLPLDPRERALALGFSTEICGPNGIGWCRRLCILEKIFGLGEAAEGALPEPLQPILRGYGFDAEATAVAPDRIAHVLSGLSQQLREQAGRGSTYFVGDQLTAPDVYWACFSLMLAPLAADVNPMPDYLWPLYSELCEVVQPALETVLIEHRDRIWADHIGLPLDY